MAEIEVKTVRPARYTTADLRDGQVGLVLNNPLGHWVGVYALKTYFGLVDLADPSFTRGEGFDPLPIERIITPTKIVVVE